MGQDPVAIVRAGYDAMAERYRAWSAAGPVRLAYVRRLLDRLPRGSVVADLGCGSGEPATRMLAEHHRVVAIDISETQLRLAQFAAPAALLVRADLTAVNFAPGSLDAVASFYALGHLPSESHGRLLASIGGWLRPGGVLLTSAPLSPGEVVDPDWLGVPMFFGGIGEAATLAAIEAGGLQVEGAERVEEDEGQGLSVTFLWVVASKPGG